MAKNLEEIRDRLHLLKLKTFYDMQEDQIGRAKNLKNILKQYETIAKASKDLIPLPGKSFQEALSTQASEYQFFRNCHSNLKHMVDYYEQLLRHVRGRVYRKIKNTEPRDINDRAINSLIDENEDVLNVAFDLIELKAMQDRYQGIMESYNQRGYSLNNITKGLEISVMETIL